MYFPSFFSVYEQSSKSIKFKCIPLSILPIVNDGGNKVSFSQLLNTNWKNVCCPFLWISLLSVDIHKRRRRRSRKEFDFDQYFSLFFSSKIIFSRFFYISIIYPTIASTASNWCYQSYFWNWVWLLYILWWKWIDPWVVKWQIWLESSTMYIFFFCSSSP